MTLIPKRKHRNSGRPAEKDARGFLQWVRGHECACAKQGGCSGKIEAAHVDYAGGKGFGTKVADRFAIPLCNAHHAEQRGETGPFRARGDWTTFEAKYGLNALRVANELWRRWPGRARWEANLSKKQDQFA